MAVTYTRANSQADTLSTGSALTWLQAKNGASVGGLYRPTTIGVASVIAEWSTNASGTERISLQLDAAGHLVVVSRRLDADSAETVTTDGTLTAGTVAHIFAVADWANGALHAYLNGVKKTVAVAGWDGASSNTASAAARIGSNTAGTVFANGTTEGLRAVGRALSEAEVLADYASTRLLIEGYDWVHQSFGQAGTAVLARACRPYEGTTIGGIATPSASAPVYAADLLERPPESEAQGLSCVADGSGRVALTGNVLGIANAVGWVLVTGHFTARDISAMQCLATVCTNGANPRASMSIETTGKLRASARRLDADATTTRDSSGTVAVGTRYFGAMLCDFAGGRLRVCVDGTWTETTDIAGWNAVCSATNSSAVYLGACAAGANHARGLLEHPRIYSGTGTPPTDEQIEAIRLANGRDIPAPINGGNVAYLDVRGRDGDVAGVMPVLGKVGATTGAVGIATPSGSVHVASTSGLRPVRVEMGGALMASRAVQYYSVTGAEKIARKVSAITIAWWGRIDNITDTGGYSLLLGLSQAASGGVRLALLMQQNFLAYIASRITDAGAVAVTPGSALVVGDSLLVASVNYATGVQQIFLNGALIGSGSFTAGSTTDDTDSLAVTIGGSGSYGEVSGVQALAAAYPFAADAAWVRDQYYAQGARALERASMLFDFTEQPLGPSGIVRCKVYPGSCYATPQGTPVPRIVRDTYMQTDDGLWLPDGCEGG